MAGDSYDVLCGTCRAPARGPDNPSPDDQISCGECGQSDRYEDVLKSVQQHAEDVTAHAMGKMMRRIAAGSKFMTVTGGTHRVGSYRWISTLEL